MQLSIIAASAVLTMTGCATKVELKAISETEFFYTVHHCPVYTEVGTQCKKPESIALIDGDDDKDGVLNSSDQYRSKNANVTKVDTDGCSAEININFKFDSFEVTADSMPDIKDFAYFMNEHKEYKANIEGHTDTSGPAEYNQILSQKRAQVVTDLIVSEGNVDASRLQAVGKGEFTPIADNATKAGRSENRRTEAHIIK